MDALVAMEIFLHLVEMKAGRTESRRNGRASSRHIECISGWQNTAQSLCHGVIDVSFSVSKPTPVCLHFCLIN